MRVHGIKSSVVALVVALAGVSGASEARTTKKQPTAAAVETPRVDPAALTALEKMGAFLRTQQKFSVHMVSATEHVLASGQKIELSATGDLLAERPGKLRAEVKGDRKHRQFFYDGKTFTMYGPATGFYATVDAPPTIAELAGVLEEKYGIALPLVDLFYWGTDQADLKNITTATFIGRSLVDNVVTDQYAFRQPGLDWQVWIEHGDKPLPRKLVLTTTDDPARPEHTVTLSWNLAPKIESTAFTFTPPKDGQKIAIVDQTAKSVTAVRSTRRPKK